MNIERFKGGITHFKESAARLNKPVARIGATAAVILAGYTLIDPGTKSVEAGGPSGTPTPSTRPAVPTRFPTPTASPTPFAPGSRTEVNVGAPSITINNIFPTPAGPTNAEILEAIETVTQGRLNEMAAAKARAEAKAEKTPTPVPPTPIIIRGESRDNVFDWGDAFMGAMVLWFLGTAAVAGTAATAAYNNRARIAQLWQDHVRIRIR